VTTITNPNWYDLNSDRAFPFLDSASRAAIEGGFVLPDDLIVDLRLSAAASLDPTKFYLSRIGAIGGGLMLTFACDGVDVATTAAPSISTEEYQSYIVAGLTGYAVNGTIVLGGASAVLAAGVLAYTFTLAATRIIPTLISPGQTGVTSLTVVDSSGRTVRLVGDITMTPGPNAEMTVEEQEIAIGMVSGVVINPCGCEDPGGFNRAAIRSINGVTPDVDGNLQVVTEGCPDLTTITNGLKLTDRCAEPCCGDAEIVAVATATRDLDRLLADLANKEAQVESALRGVEGWLQQ
jgi:hypothetical protein